MQVDDGGLHTVNFGLCGDKREQQLVFRNDEHVQHGTDHIMVELRTGGYVEVNGLRDALDLKPQLDNFVKNGWRCKDYTKYAWEKEDFCDHKYTASRNLFGAGLTTMLGRRTLEMSRFMAAQGWELLLATGGSVQLHRRILREQQLHYTRARTLERATAPLLLIQFRTVPQSYGSHECTWVGYKCVVWTPMQCIRNWMPSSHKTWVVWR